MAYNASMNQALPQHVQAVVLFDGDCGLCQRSVRFAAKRDHADALRFASQHTPTGQAWLKQAGLSELPNSVVFYELKSEAVALQSSAVLRLAAHLGFPYRLAWLGYIVPACLRDLIYRGVAAIRRKLFKPNACMFDEQVQSRLLDLGELPMQDNR